MSLSLCLSESSHVSLKSKHDKLRGYNCIKSPPKVNVAGQKCKIHRITFYIYCKGGIFSILNLSGRDRVGKTRNCRRYFIGMKGFQDI